VYTGEEIVVKKPKLKAAIYLSSNEKAGLFANPFVLAAWSFIMRLFGEQFTSYLSQYFKVVWRLAHGDFGVLVRRHSPLIEGYRFAECLSPGIVAEYKIVKNLTVRVRTRLGVRTLVIPEAIVQRRVNMILIDEIKRLAAAGNIESAKALIDQVLNIDQALWREGIYSRDLDLFSNTGLLRGQVVLLDCGGFVDDYAVAVEDLRGKANCLRKMAIQPFPPDVIDYYVRRAAETFEIENFKRQWAVECRQPSSVPAVSPADAAGAGTRPAPTTGNIIDAANPALRAP